MKKRRTIFLVLSFIVAALVTLVIYAYNKTAVNDYENSIGNIFSEGLVASSENELYHMETHDGKAGLYCSDISLTKTKKIYDGFCYYINTTEDQIYFVDSNGYPHVMNKDGSDISKLSNFKISYMYLYNDKIYGIVGFDNSLEYWKNHESHLFSMDLNGENAKIL